MNVNREGNFKISVMKSNRNTLKVVKERTLEGTRQYNNKTRSVLNPLTMSEFYSNRRNMNDSRASTWNHYSNIYPFNRKNQFNNNFQSSGSAACPINTQYWPTHTQSEYDYCNGPNYYEYDHNHSNFCSPVNVHTLHSNQYQNQLNTNDYSQYNYFKEYSCQNNYYGQNLRKSSNRNYYCGANAEIYQKSRTLVTTSSNVQQQNNKKQKFMNKLSIDTKHNGFNRPVYQKKCSSIKHIQDMKKVDHCPRTKQISRTNTSSTKYESIKCEIIDLCEEDTNENCPTTINNSTETVSEEVKRKKNPETNAPNNQDLCEIKNVYIETNENCATNTIKIKSGTATVSEEVKKKKNLETNTPNNQDLCEIKDVSIETNEDCATNTIKIKNCNDTVSEEVKRKENPETFFPNKQDLCEIKDVSIETNEDCATNKIKIRNCTDTVSEEVKRKENPETFFPNKQDLCEINDVSIETNEGCATNTIKIKNGIETFPEDVKRKENPETNAPNNQDLREIKDVSIETNENCPTNTVKIKNGSETFSEEVKRKENPETNALNNQDLREIKDVSIETKDNSQIIKGHKCKCDEVSSKNITDDTIIDIFSEIVEVTTDCKTNASVNKTLSNNINQVFSCRDTIEKDPQTESKKTYHNVTNLSNETKATCQKNVTKIKICSDCNEVFPCNTQQNCEQNFKVTKKIRDTKILEMGKGLATMNKTCSCATKSIDHHKKSNLLSVNKKSLDPSILMRKEKVETWKSSKFLKAQKNDSGSNIFKKDTKDLCKKKSYVDIFSKQKIDASYKIPKLSKCNIKNNSEAIETTLLKCNNNESNISEEKKDVKVIGDIKSTIDILESHGTSKYKSKSEKTLQKKSEKYTANKKMSMGNLSKNVKTINKYKHLECNNEANKISHEKRDVNVIRVTKSIKNTAVSPKISTNLKNTEPKETSIDKISGNDKVSKRIERKHYGTAKSMHNKTKHANDINPTDGERHVSCNKDTKKSNIVKNKTGSGDKTVSKINEINKRKLTLDESFKDKKKHKSGKLTSKIKPAIVKTCNEQFNTLKSVVHVSNHLVVEKEKQQNCKHETSSRKERLTGTLTENRDDLLITVDKDKKIKVKSNVKGEIQKNKKHTKQKSNLNIIINITYPEKTSKQKCTKETYSVEDLSFLDDINVDEIVKSLNNC